MYEMALKRQIWLKLSSSSAERKIPIELKRNLNNYKSEKQMGNKLLYTSKTESYKKNYNSRSCNVSRRADDT